MPETGVLIRIKGQVQGVGFRPFVWQLAHQFRLLGEVYNDANGVGIKLKPDSKIEQFIDAISQYAPKLSVIDSITQSNIEIKSYTDFVISQSNAGIMDTSIAPDAATCEHCLQEIHDSKDSRHGYEFTNCIHCGPRYSIIKAIPYDRANTSMASFELCNTCQLEYQDPRDRRFHAQPTACPTCGPSITVQDNQGKPVSQAGGQPLDWCAKQLLCGKTVAIKGVGGFHLAVDATNACAVTTLRHRKHRPHKPFALMVKDIDAVRAIAYVNQEEQRQLLSAAAPIVLLKPKPNSLVAENVSFAMPYIGIMLPSNPLQHLLLELCDRPLVMTSANKSGFPMPIDNLQALAQLGQLCDLFLTHNRDIVRRLDDSIVQVIDGKASIMRRARGYVPQMLDLPAGFEHCDGVLALGSDLKQATCITKRGRALMMPHLGDASNPMIVDEIKTTIQDTQSLFAHQTTLGAYDCHTGYITHQYANALFTHVAQASVNHHHAHIAACLADNQISRYHNPMLAVTLDGLGWNDDIHDNCSHNLFGGELFIANYATCQRITGLPAVPLIGGDKASIQPWRNLLAQLETHVPTWQTHHGTQVPNSALQQLSCKPLPLLRQAMKNNINSPIASSTGRLFDAVAALVSDVFEQQSFEGQAAMTLEGLAWQGFNMAHLELTDLQHSDPNPSIELMWQHLLLKYGQQSNAHIALFFHRYLAHIVLCWLHDAKPLASTNQVVLSGGVMQNSLLLMLLKHGLTKQNQIPLIHSTIPANDGGISVGQALIAWHRRQLPASGQLHTGATN
ncbi:carbamoyltransferase HypF [Vibrio gallicus]|uniref:carbamoyltransferase HypF n=1 Tax=Vibrio gallicus TaxID=190897 RepID=UPI0021C27160|nr:carbamoyltransferase HypF [Vibrio gallicus]